LDSHNNGNSTVPPLRVRTSRAVICLRVLLQHHQMTTPLGGNRAGLLGCRRVPSATSIGTFISRYPLPPFHCRWPHPSRESHPPYSFGEFLTSAHKCQETCPLAHPQTSSHCNIGRLLIPGTVCPLAVWSTDRWTSHMHLHSVCLRPAETPSPIATPQCTPCHAVSTHVSSSQPHYCP
jgi:hypothetical protein